MNTETKNDLSEQDKSINYYENKLSELSDSALIVGKLISLIIIVSAFAISGFTGSDFIWIYLVVGVFIAAINIFFTYVLSRFLRVISNISMSLKNK